jgi:putative membrane protein
MKHITVQFFSIAALGVGLIAASTSFAASNADSKFAIAAAHGGETEVEFGKLAAEKATNPDVKAFGQQMVDDHGKANEKLMQIGQEKSMKLPASMDTKQQAMYAKLKMLSGSAFDRAYVNSMVKDHDEDVREFTKEANSGADPKLKQFAADTLPVIQGHLDKIKSIQAKIGGSAGGM